MERLTQFVNLTAKTVDIKNVYTASQLENQTTFVEELVEDICKNVGEMNPALAIEELIRRGSYYDGSKILRPDEYDFEPVLKLSKYITEVSETSKTSWSNQGFKDIKINADKLPESLPDGCLGDLDEEGEAELNGSELLSVLRITVARALEHMGARGTVKFRGERDHLNGPESSYSIDEVTIHEDLHGPSVWLRVGAPLGTTDIDLCFCLKWKPHELGPSVMIFKGCVWLESLISPPNDYRYKLTENHKKLFLTLKYIAYITSTSILSSKDYSVSSYTLRTVILYHQQECRTKNVGECFTSVMKAMLVKPYEEFNCDENIMYLSERSMKIPDVVFQKRSLEIDSYMRPALLITMLWIVQHIKLNKNTDWWGAFLSTNIINDIKIKGARMFQSLVDSVKKYRALDGSGYKSCHKREWLHDDKNSKLFITGYYFEGDISQLKLGVLDKSYMID